MIQSGANSQRANREPGAIAPRIGKAKIFTAVFVLCVALIAFFYFWSAGLSGAGRLSSRPEGYYNWQTLGFMRGHLYVGFDPNPALLALPDPYDPVANAPYRVHDMTLWQGKYYLYFGVAPVLLLFLPFRLITGQFLSEPVAVALFCTIGFGAASALVVDLRRRWFPKVSQLHMIVMVAALGLGCPTLLLNQLPQFYQVPIACAYALSMAGVFCLARMLVADEARRKGWLVATGILFGLTQAARPNYVLAMPLLLLPVWWYVGGPLNFRSSLKRFVVPLFLAFGPVLLIGLALLIYNWARFGNPFEFGMRYQLAGQSFTSFTPLALSYLSPHAAEYLWQQVWWQTTFPFLEGKPEAPFGVLRYLPLTWIGLLAFWPIALQGDRQNSGKLVLVAVVAGLGVTNLAMDSVFFFAPTLRYICDFSPALILLGVIGAMLAAQVRRIGPWLGAAAALCAVASMAVVLAIYVQRLPQANKPEALAHLFNKAAAIGEKWLGQRYGPLRLTLELPQNPAVSVEPIFQTGYSDDRRDWLQVHYLSATQIQFGFFHAGLGEILGKVSEVPPDRRLVIEAACGALLPVQNHPFFSGWSAAEVGAALRKLEVRVNGAEVLSAAIQCYPSRPWDLQIGTTGFISDPVRQKFSGRTLKVEKMPVVRESLPPRDISAHRPLRLRLQLPAGGTGYEPLVAVGERGRGELLYLVYGPAQTIQLALDSQGRGAIFGRPVKIKPAADIFLDLWMGSWAVPERDGSAKGKIEAPERRLYAKLGEDVIFNVDYSFQPKGNVPAALGWNRVGSGAAAAEFTGRILDVQEIDWASLPAKPNEGKFGAVDMDVEFPRNIFGQAEPLVTTGRSGAGDILFVRYLDGGLIQFGLDHWGRGLVTAPAVAIDYDKVHRLEISMGSLYEAAPPGWGRRVLLRLDGQVVLDTEVDFYPSAPQNIQVGMNMIGGSTAGPSFSGRVVELRRPDQMQK